MDEAIIRYVRRKHQLLIGEANAERIKIEAGTAQADVNGRAAEVHIRGRDLRKGWAKSAVLTPKDIAEALSEPIETMADFVQRALEELPPDILSDITRRGIHLTGGGALLDKLDVALTRRVGVKFHVQQNPMHCVVKGSAAVLAGARRARAPAHAALALGRAGSARSANFSRAKRLLAASWMLVGGPSNLTPRASLWRQMTVAG